jgi:subtilisin family serine protease
MRPCNAGLCVVFVGIFLGLIFWTSPSAMAENLWEVEEMASHEAVMVRGNLAHPERLIARFNHQAQARLTTKNDRKQALSALGVNIVREVEFIPGLVGLQVESSSRRDKSMASDLRLEAKIKELMSSGLFEYVEPDWLQEIMQGAIPSDSAFTDGRLWGLRNTGQSGGVAGADINALDAWNITTGSRDVVVAVIDTGIRYTHQDLAGNMWINTREIPGTGRDDDGNGYIDDVYGINAITGSGDPWDDNGHGTHCAGTIGATANDSGPHVGVAWNVRLMALKFLSAGGSGWTIDAIECIQYATLNGADIMSNSWGGGGYSQGLFDAIDAAHRAGILFIAAAGNAASNNDNNSFYPANYQVPNVISVAALNRNDALAWFSNFGRNTVHLGAPGEDIFSSTAFSDSSYDSYSGTSMATPHVAGVAALLKSRFPQLNDQGIKSRLLSGVTRISALEGRTITGGRLNAYRALTAEADGNMELNAWGSANPLPESDTVIMYVGVTDLTPVIGATVTASFEGEASVSLFDNGIYPDDVPDDGIYSATMFVPSGYNPIALNVSARAAGQQDAEAVFMFEVNAPPSNDNFRNRITLEPGTTQTTGSNRDATSEAGEPINPVVAGGKTVWWSWTAPATEWVTITTAGSDYDTTLAVYEGDRLDSLILLDSNDDCIGLQSCVNFQAIQGVAYALQVDGFAGRMGNIVLNYPDPGAGGESPPSIIAGPRSAVVLVGNPFRLEVEVAGAPPLDYAWYKDDMPVGGNENFYEVDRAQREDEGSYYVVVANSYGSVQSGIAVVTVESVIINPENDDFADAEELAGFTGRITERDNSLATGEAGEPDHAGGAGAPDNLKSLWWKFTAPSPGVFEVDTFGSNFDTVLAAYVGNDVASLTEIAANDDADGSLQSRIEFEAQAGETYYIAVDGYFRRTGLVSINYLFTPTIVDIPNDDFDSRVIIASAGGSYSGYNLGATGEDGEPNHAGVARPLASVWWSWTAQSSSLVTVDTWGSNFDTVLAVYTGDSVETLILIGANDDSGGRLQSRVLFDATAGQTYHFAVDGYGNSQGFITLNIRYGANMEPTGAVLLIPSPPEGGAVIGAGSYVVGSRQTIAAVAGAGYVFTSWDDNNTDNPRELVVSEGETTYTALFGLTPTRSIELSGNLNFGDLPIGETAQRTLTIRNSGNSALTVSGINYPQGFSGDWSGVLQAGSAANIAVTFAPAQLRNYSGTITVNADQTSGAITITCSGSGVLSVSDWEAGYTDLNFDGWRRLSWFGNYRPMGGGWIFHDRHDFWYAFPDSTPSDIFYWSMDMGWLWTSSTTYSWLYRFEPPAWLWYVPNSGNPRWFFNSSIGDWETHP